MSICPQARVLDCSPEEFSRAALPVPIGNDVVDLVAAGAQPPRNFARYAARVCTPRELVWLDAVFAVRRESERIRAVWSLWAAKEAAYKAAHPRESGEGSLAGNSAGARFDFIPRQIEVRPDSDLRAATAIVRRNLFPDLRLRVRFAHSARWVHALCYPEWGLEPHYWIASALRFAASGATSDESSAVRELVHARVEELWGTGRAAVRIGGGGRGAGARPPYLELGPRPNAGTLRLPISMSHDGGWVAAAVPRIPLPF